ncbi:MAG: flavin reductase family protein [Chlorobi bacterium]|nr:flavin reductase family protein [Chlorobiota bacterium]
MNEKRDQHSEQLFLTFSPDDMTLSERNHIMLGGIAPRPIALVGTISGEGYINLAPFSFYNALSANPPIVAFSPAFRGSDGSPKHTLLNILETGEFTINAVTSSMAEQVSLTSADYPAGVDEFVKAGLTRRTSEVIKPPGVAESPFIMECKLYDHQDFGGGPGSGNLILGEVVRFHVSQSIYIDGRLDPFKLDLIGRMGGEWYCRARGSALVKIARPRHTGIGIDALPYWIRTSSILAGNDLAGLAGVERLPDAEDIRRRWREYFAIDSPESPGDFDAELERGDGYKAREILVSRMKAPSPELLVLSNDLHRLCRVFLRAGDIKAAWECAWLGDAEKLEELLENM